LFSMRRHPSHTSLAPLICLRRDHTPFTPHQPHHVVFDETTLLSHLPGDLYHVVFDEITPLSHSTGLIKSSSTRRHPSHTLPALSGRLGRDDIPLTSHWPRQVVFDEMTPLSHPTSSIKSSSTKRHPSHTPPAPSSHFRRNNTPLIPHWPH
jgi:hypothetical protein